MSIYGYEVRVLNAERVRVIYDGMLVAKFDRTEEDLQEMTESILDWAFEDGTIKSQRIKKLRRKDEMPVEESYDLYGDDQIITKDETIYSDTGRIAYQKRSDGVQTSELKIEPSVVPGMSNISRTTVKNGMLVDRYTSTYTQLPTGLIECNDESSTYIDNKWKNSRTTFVYKQKGDRSLMVSKVRQDVEGIYSSQCKSINGCNVVYYNGDIYINREDCDDMENYTGCNGLTPYFEASGDIEYQFFGLVEGTVIYENNKVKSIIFEVNENDKNYFVKIMSHRMFGIYGYSFSVEEKDAQGNMLNCIDASYKGRKNDEIQGLVNTISSVFFDAIKTYRGFELKADYTDTGYASALCGHTYKYLLDQFEKG
jgi:hypothetical protein